MSSTTVTGSMTEAGVPPGSSSRRKPRGNLARLVSKFEVLDLKHSSDKKSRGSASSGPSQVSGTSTPKHDKKQASAAPQSYDGANDLTIDVCLSRASSCRWPPHMLYSNADGEDEGVRLKGQTSPARAVIARQTSVAERRKAFEGWYGMGKVPEAHEFALDLAEGDLSILPSHNLPVSLANTNIEAQPTHDGKVESSAPADKRLLDGTSSERQSWATSVTEWHPTKESPSQTSPERDQGKPEVAESQSSLREAEPKVFVSHTPEPFLVIEYDEGPDISLDLGLDQEISTNDNIVEASSERKPLPRSMPLLRPYITNEADGAVNVEDGNIYIPRMSMCAQKTIDAKLVSRAASPENTSGQPLSDFTNRLSPRLEKMQSFPGHNYVTNDQQRSPALPYLWEKARGKLLERPSNPRLLRKSAIPFSRTDGLSDAQLAEQPSIPPSKTCGPGLLTAGAKSWAVKQNPSPLKDRIGMFKALSRQESGAHLSSKPKQLRVSLGRQTAGKVREALRIFSLSKDKKQNDSSTDAAARAADSPGPKTWGASRLFRSDTSASGSRPFSSAAFGSSWARFGHGKGASKAESAPAAHRFSARDDDGDDGDSVTTSLTRPSATPQISVSDAFTSPADPTTRLARRRGFSRNNTPQVRRAECKLEQPKPVRGSDMKRLVSLCKERVSRHVFRGESEAGYNRH